ncbi:MAG: hypothetical protein Q9224_005211 [Gallowayella concinna]
MAYTITFRRAPTAATYELYLQKHDVPEPGENQVLVEMLAAPINPLDVLVLQDKYPVKPQNHQQDRPIPGYDGVGKVIACGDKVDGLHEGDRIIIKHHGLGTWRTHAILSAHDTLKIPNDMELGAAAILRMGIMMAYLMMETNSEAARPGDWIIMNGATSVIAHFLGQFAHARGLKVISIIRDREDAEATARLLKRHSADIVLQSHEVESTKELQNKRIMLGFDAVFGPGGSQLINCITPGGRYVSYGFLGGLGPGSAIPISQELIFIKHLTFKSFRLSAALAAMTEDEQSALCGWISIQLQKGRLTMPLLESIEWNGEVPDERMLKEAIAKASVGGLGQYKQIFRFS